MEIKHRKDDDDVTDNNVIDFNSAKILTGGKGGGSDNWLKDIEPQTCIIVQKRPFHGQPKDALCMEYTVMTHLQNMDTKEWFTLLYSDLNPPAAYLWVNTQEFSKSVMLGLIGSKKDVD